MKANKKKMSTYRFTEQLNNLIKVESEKLGISRNSLVQMTLTKALQEKYQRSQQSKTKEELQEV